MAWSTLPTYVNGVLSASMLNAIAANINETAAAKATTAGRHFAATGTNAIAEREIRQAYDTDAGTRTSTSFGDLTGSTAGPTISSIVTGVLALVFVQCQLNNDTAGPSSRMSFDVSGATTSAATDDRGILNQNTASRDNRFGTCELQALTAGTNTMKSVYRVSSGTGSFSARTIIVMGL